MATIDLKTGWKTSEFWLAVVPATTGLLLALGIVSPEQLTAVNDSNVVIVKAVVQVIGAIVSALSTFGYVKGRSEVKAAFYSK